MPHVDNAIILAAGTSSRFAPLSREHHKALTVVRGEILIERQIRQLKDAGIADIIIVTGYKAEEFSYLVEDFGVRIIHNPFYKERNNNSSIWVARDYISNSYICSSDNWFNINPFETEVPSGYYAAEFAEGDTNEWCLSVDNRDIITSVNVGGHCQWYMMGHVFWDQNFSSRFLQILSKEYDKPETAAKLWESIYAEHLDELELKIRRYEPGDIFEFDSLDELRLFDSSYYADSHSRILKEVAKRLSARETDFREFRPLKGKGTEAVGFSFIYNGIEYNYNYDEGKLIHGRNTCKGN